MNEKKRNLSIADKVDLFTKAHKVFLLVTFTIMLIVCMSYCMFVCALYPDNFSRTAAGIFFIIIFLSSFALPKYYSIPSIIFVAAIIFIGTPTLEAYCIKDAKCKIEVITDKQVIEYRFYRRHNTTYRITLNGNKGHIDISKTDYKRVKVGDTIVMKYAINYPHIKKVHIIKPTHKEIELYKVPQHLIGNDLQPKPIVEKHTKAMKDSLLQQSYCQVGYVYDKIDDEYFRHFLRIGIADSLTIMYEFYETERLYSKVYKRINVGDKVILQVSKTNPQINRVLNWQPHGEEIDMLFKPIDYADYKKMIAYNDSKKYEYLDKSTTIHYAYVLDKYEDEYVGAYLDIGIDEKYARTYVFKKYSDIYESTYQALNIGDAVIAELSESSLQVKRIIDWRLPRNKQ